MPPNSCKLTQLKVQHECSSKLNIHALFYNSVGGEMKKIFIPLLLMVSILSFAADDGCEKYLKDVNYNQKRYLSQEQKEQLEKAKFCVAKYESASSSEKAQIEASVYGLGDGSGETQKQNITTKQDNTCEGKYGAYWYSNTLISDEKVVSDKVMETVQSCIKANAAGLHIEPTLTDDGQLVVSASWTTKGDLVLRNIIKSPEDGVHCTLDGKDSDKIKNRKIDVSNALTFSCTRDAKTKTIGSEKVEYLPQVLITADLDANPFTLLLPKLYITNPFDNSIKQLEEELKKEKNRVREFTITSLDSFPKTYKQDSKNPTDSDCYSYEVAMTGYNKSDFCTISAVHGNISQPNEYVKIIKKNLPTKPNEFWWYITMKSCSAPVSVDVDCQRISLQP
jgi:hypothetical protein